MKFTTVFFDIDYCLLDTPTSERRIIRELYAQQGQTVGDEVGDTYREISSGYTWTRGRLPVSGCM